MAFQGESSGTGASAIFLLSSTPASSEAGVFLFRCVLRLDACGSSCFCGCLAPLGGVRAADYRVGGCAGAAHGGRKTEKCTLLDLPWQKKRVMHAFAARRGGRVFRFCERQPSDLGNYKADIVRFAVKARCSKKNRAFLEKTASWFFEPCISRKKWQKRFAACLSTVYMVYILCMS